jgi:hypothetical protein
MLDRVKNMPAMPVVWGANQPGMQAGGELEGSDLAHAKDFWIEARDRAVAAVERYLELAHAPSPDAPEVRLAHKQIVNRILEPFLWHTVIVTATEWSNFFALRCDAQAQPEIHEIAVLMRTAYESSVPTPVGVGDWHTPLIQPEEELDLEQRKKISVARCARVSYLTHDGRRDIEADLTLHDRLLASGHMSPFEHVATPASASELPSIGQINPLQGNFRGWEQYRKFIPGEAR